MPALSTTYVIDDRQTICVTFRSAFAQLKYNYIRNVSQEGLHQYVISYSNGKRFHEAITVKHKRFEDRTKPMLVLDVIVREPGNLYTGNFISVVPKRTTESSYRSFSIV